MHMRERTWYALNQSRPLLGLIPCRKPAALKVAPLIRGAREMADDNGEVIECYDCQKQKPIVPSMSSNETTLTVQCKQHTTSPTNVMGFDHSRQFEASASMTLSNKRTLRNRSSLHSDLLHREIEVCFDNGEWYTGTFVKFWLHEDCPWDSRFSQLRCVVAYGSEPPLEHSIDLVQGLMGPARRAPMRWPFTFKDSAESTLLPAKAHQPPRAMLLESDGCDSGVGVEAGLSSMCKLLQLAEGAGPRHVGWLEENRAQLLGGTWMPSRRCLKALDPGLIDPRLKNEAQWRRMHPRQQKSAIDGYYFTVLEQITHIMWTAEYGCDVDGPQLMIEHFTERFRADLAAGDGSALSDDGLTLDIMGRVLGCYLHIELQNSSTIWGRDLPAFLCHDFAGFVADADAHESVLEILCDALVERHNQEFLVRLFEWTISVPVGTGKLVSL